MRDNILAFLSAAGMLAALLGMVVKYVLLPYLRERIAEPLQDVLESQAATDVKIDGLKEQMGKIGADVESLRVDVSSLRDRSTRLETRMDILERDLARK